jgi:hypothetical protein
MKAKTGSVAGFINKRLKYVRKFAPSLVTARASLIPFEDLFLSESAGPQNHEELNSEEPHFVIQVPGHGYCDVVEFKVTADSVNMEILMYDESEDSHGMGFVQVDEQRATMAKMFEYLRQLPRPPHTFVRGGVKQ